MSAVFRWLYRESQFFHFDHPAVYERENPYFTAYQIIHSSQAFLRSTLLCDPNVRKKIQRASPTKQIRDQNTPVRSLHVRICAVSHQVFLARANSATKRDADSQRWVKSDLRNSTLTSSAYAGFRIPTPCFQGTYATCKKYKERAIFVCSPPTVNVSNVDNTLYNAFICFLASLVHSRIGYRQWRLVLQVAYSPANIFVF